MYVCVHTLKNTLVPGNLYSNLWPHIHFFHVFCFEKKKLLITIVCFLLAVFYTSKHFKGTTLKVSQTPNPL